MKKKKTIKYSDPQYSVYGPQKVEFYCEEPWYNGLTGVDLEN